MKLTNRILPRSHLKRGWLPLAAVLTLAMVIAGCGSGNSSSAASVTKKEVLAKGEKICAQTKNTQISALHRLSKEWEEERLKHPHVPPISIAARQKLVVSRVGLPPMRRQAEELSELGTSSEDNAGVQAIVSAIEEAIAQSEQNPELAILPSGENAFAEASHLATEYGLKKCGEI